MFYIIQMISGCRGTIVWIEVTWKQCHSHLRHDFVLTFLHILPVSFHNGFQEFEVLNMSSMCFNAVDKMMDHAVADLIAQLVVVHKDVTQCLGFQQLVKNMKRYTDSFVWQEKDRKVGQRVTYFGPCICHYKLIVPLLLHALLEKRTFQKKKGMSTRGKCSEGKSIYPWSEEEVQVFM